MCKLLNILYKFICILCKLIDGCLTHYARLRTFINDRVQEENRCDAFKKKRNIIGIVFLGASIFYTFVCAVSSVIDWYGIVCNMLYIAMILFWVFAAEYYTDILKDQETYFKGDRYKSTYKKYKKWMGGGEVPVVSKIYYGLWIIVSAILLIYAISLKIYRLDLPLRFLNLILLIIVLVLSGNSVFSTAVFTYFTCDLYNNERFPQRNENPDSEALPYNETRPGQTVGLQKLLIDARAHSASFLSYALCYALCFSIQVWEYMKRNEMDSLSPLMNEERFQVIVAFLVLICVAMYIVSTIGSRYFLKKLLEMWKLKQKEVIQATAGKEQMHEKIDQRLDALEKDKISPFPSMLEIIITALLGSLVTSVLSVLIK